MRALVRETVLAADDFILPVFVKAGLRGTAPIASLPGHAQHGEREVGRAAVAAWQSGVRAILLFGIPEVRDETGAESFSDDGIVQRAVRWIKAEVPDMVVITDVCLCAYLRHGHCGLVAVTSGPREGFEVRNDATLEVLGRIAVSQAGAGADVVAPSDMMDGRVQAIRAALDAQGQTSVPILSYSSKYASSLYGPFREAAGSAPRFGDRRSYQMDPGNAAEALREMAADLAEGADFLMLKPAMAYLDVIWRAKERFQCPIVAYQVSGEYAMVKAAAARGWVEEETVMWELLTCIKRAGADLIVSYFAKTAAAKLTRGGRS